MCLALKKVDTKVNKNEYKRSTDKEWQVMGKNANASESEEIKALRKEVLDLKNQLYHEKMRVDFYDTMVDVAEEMFGIEIRKLPRSHIPVESHDRGLNESPICELVRGRPRLRCEAVCNRREQTIIMARKAARKNTRK